MDTELIDIYTISQHDALPIFLQAYAALLLALTLSRPTSGKRRLRRSTVQAVAPRRSVTSRRARSPNRAVLAHRGDRITTLLYPCPHTNSYARCCVTIRTTLAF